MAVRSKRKARPLDFTAEFTAYKSHSDIKEITQLARRNCQMGAVLGASGFAALLAAVSPFMPLPALAALLGGAAANCYILVVMGQRLLGKLAARHVERVVILPTPEESRGREPERPVGKGDEDKFASILFSAATVEERLQSTPELRVKIRTGSAERYFSLIDIPEDLEAHGFATDLGQGAVEGEFANRPAAFGDLCSRIGLLHVDMEDGIFPDQPLLDALLSSGKIVVDERAEALEDGGHRQHTGPMLSEMTVGDVEQAARIVDSESPAKSIVKIGRKAVLGGASVMVAGMVFFAGENARDKDGVARWRNLPI